MFFRGKKMVTLIELMGLGVCIRVMGLLKSLWVCNYSPEQLPGALCCGLCLVSIV